MKHAKNSQETYQDLSEWSELELSCPFYRNPTMMTMMKRSKRLERGRGKERKREETKKKKTEKFVYLLCRDEPRRKEGCGE